MHSIEWAWCDGWCGAHCLLCSDVSRWCVIAAGSTIQSGMDLCTDGMSMANGKCTEVKARDDQSVHVLAMWNDGQLLKSPSEQSRVDSERAMHGWPTAHTTCT